MVDLFHKIKLVLASMQIGVSEVIDIIIAAFSRRIRAVSIVIKPVEIVIIVIVRASEQALAMAIISNFTQCCSSCHKLTGMVVTLRINYSQLPFGPFKADCILLLLLYYSKPL